MGILRLQPTKMGELNIIEENIGFMAKLVNITRLAGGFMVLFLRTNLAMGHHLKGGPRMTPPPEALSVPKLKF